MINKYNTEALFSKKSNKKDKILGGIGYGFPLVSLLIVLFMIGLIISNFALLGLPNVTWSFLTHDPKNMNTEGGIFPAIYGTFLLVLVMVVIGVPIGTMTAIYLNEYALQSSIFSKIIRFAVNTLAGVPSIVYGLFGLGFFIQTVGANIDTFKWNSLRENTVQVLTLKNAPLEGKSSSLQEITSYLKNIDSIKFRSVNNFIQEYPNGESVKINSKDLNNFLLNKVDLKWGKPSLLWAALTLALLTLPVVIVSVEEALRTVPKEIREASLALGATKFETIYKIVIPSSIGGILTGAILAVSRGAGEVAPILLTGVVYSQQSLPKSLSDQFMHLGYHLYVLATQSPDVDKTMPIQYATTLVLIALTLALNIIAIIIRSRIRRKTISY